MNLFQQAAKWTLRLGALAVVALWLGQFVPAAIARTDTQRDMILYYNAARATLENRPLYTPRPHYGPDSKPFDYLYPPPFAAAIAPMGKLSWLSFARLWTTALLVSCLIYAFCLMHLSGRRDVWSFAIALAALILFPGANRAVSLGQIDPFLWCVFGASVGVATSRPSLSGTLLGVASSIKIYSIWPLLALKRSEFLPFWRGAALVGVAGIALGALVCGPRSYLEWAHAVLPVAAQGTFNPDNFSLGMAGLRAAQLLGWHYAGGPLTGFPKWWLSGFAILGPLLAVAATRRLDVRWRLTLVGCAAAWCAPLCWSTYLPLALVPLALTWRTVARRRGTAREIET